jgi:hypothetical protein
MHQSVIQATTVDRQADRSETDIVSRHRIDGEAMDANAKPKQRGQFLWYCGVGVAIAGVLNFAFAIFMWLWTLEIAIKLPGAPKDVNWGHFWLATPSPILFAVFLCSLLYRRRKRLFWSLLIAGIAIAVCWSAYDGVHQNYQMQGMTLEDGCFHTYLNWPWMSVGLENYLLRLFSGHKAPQPETRPSDDTERDGAL